MNEGWVGFTEDGVWDCTGVVVFEKKKDIVHDMSSAYLDPRETPKVVRVSKMHYLYLPKDVDYPSRFRGDELTIKHTSILSKDEMEELIKYLLRDGIE